VLGLLGASCGGASTDKAVDGGSDTVSVSANGCADVQASCRIPIGHVCTDYAGNDLTTLGTLETLCTEQTGGWSTNPCNTTGSVGGCKASTGAACAVGWQFPPDSASAGKSACTAGAAGDTWVSP
jgi:hypothetical protein